MSELTKEDFAKEAYWTLWSLWDELPIYLEDSSEEEFNQLPKAVKFAVALDHIDEDTVLKGVDYPSHYNYMMIRLGELKEEMEASGS